MRHSQVVRSVVDVLDLYVSDPDTTTGFYNRFLRPIEDPVERERILEDYSRPQINSAIRYSLSGLTANPFLRDRGYSREVSLEVGGNLPYLLDRYLFSPGQVEGLLPGLPGFSRRGTANRLRYRRYIRLTLDLRQYIPIGTASIVAGKFFAGWAYPIGQSLRVPFDRRFYIGGANSVMALAIYPTFPGCWLVGSVVYGCGECVVRPSQSGDYWRKKS